MANATCSVDACPRPTRSSGSDLCGMHYHRQYRHGSVHAVFPKQATRTTKGRRYKLKSCPGHPLANKAGYTYEHRLVLFEVIGLGPHACHWCSKAIHWGGRSTDSLAVDHLDGYGDNNDPANLVPSCPPCNTGRAIKEKHDANKGQWWNGVGADAVLRTLPPRKLT